MPRLSSFVQLPQNMNLFVFLPAQARYSHPGSQFANLVMEFLPDQVIADLISFSGIFCTYLVQIAVKIEYVDS
jgi:hypothetical protein